MEKCLIAAIADDLALGKDNDLLWHLSEDLKYFKGLTSGHPVIMGRRTFESLGRPLPRRLNIIVSRNAAALAAASGVAPGSASPVPGPNAGGSVPSGATGTLPRPVAYASSLDEAFSLAENTLFEGRTDEPDQCFVIGGGSIYAQALGCCDKLYLTEVHTVRPDADTFFPAFDKSVWKERSRSETFREGDLTYEFVVYGR